MKKNTIIIILTMIMVFSIGGTASAALPESNEIVIPNNIIITECTNEFQENLDGSLYVYGVTKVPVGYKSEVVVELQRYDSGWRTVTQFSSSSSPRACVDEDVSPARGYLYRLKLTHRGYDSSWNLLETITKYSNEIDYF